MLTYRDNKFDNIERYGCPRVNRYLYAIPSSPAECNPIIKCILSKQIPTRYANYIRNAINEPANGLIGVLENNEYAMVFINDGGLDTCALQLSFSLQDRALIRHFCSTCTQEQLEILIKVCRKIAFDRQRAKLIKNEDTEYIVYSQYPNPDWHPTKFIRYVDQTAASKVVNNQSLRLILDCFSRGISYETLSSIFPLDYMAIFQARSLSEFEAAQLAALESGWERLSV